MDDQPTTSRTSSSHPSLQSVENLSKYAIFSNTLDVWKAIKELEEDDIQEDDVDIEFEENQTEGGAISNLNHQPQPSSILKQEFAETSVKYEQQVIKIEVDSHLPPNTDQAEPYVNQQQQNEPEQEDYTPIINHSPIRDTQKEHTFPRNVRRKLSNSIFSPASAPPTTIRRSPIIRPSPPLGLNTPTISMMATPTDLPSSPSSGGSEGLSNNINANENPNDAGSLERNVSSLNIAMDGPGTRDLPSSKLEHRRKSSPPRQQHTPPINIGTNADSPRSRPEQMRAPDHFAIPATVPKKTNGNHHNHSFSTFERKVPQAPREQEKITINKHDYTILKEIGRGSSGKVFQVLGHTYCQILALKWIEVKHDEDRQSIMNEIELLKSLDKHDNIVCLLDYKVTPSVIFMVMEYGEIDLAQLIQKQTKKAWDINFIKYYWNQMLHAVYVIHQNNIVHSDLKPANFVIVKGWLKLIDFGIAKKVSDDTTNIERVVQVGTINYMSPEALLDINEGRGEAGSLMKLGRPSDVWSLGCILYQMVYGKTPFYHLPLAQKVMCIPNPDYAISFPTTISTGDNSKSIEVPPVLLKVLKGCLNRNPLLRPPLTELMFHSFVN